MRTGAVLSVGPISRNVRSGETGARGYPAVFPQQHVRIYPKAGTVQLPEARELAIRPKP